MIEWLISPVAEVSDETRRKSTAELLREWSALVVVGQQFIHVQGTTPPTELLDKVDDVGRELDRRKIIVKKV